MVCWMLHNLWLGRGQDRRLLAPRRRLPQETLLQPLGKLRTANSHLPLILPLALYQYQTSNGDGTKTMTTIRILNLQARLFHQICHKNPLVVVWNLSGAALSAINFLWSNLCGQSDIAALIIRLINNARRMTGVYTDKILLTISVVRCSVILSRVKTPPRSSEIEASVDRGSEVGNQQNDLLLMATSIESR